MLKTKLMFVILLFLILIQVGVASSITSCTGGFSPTGITLQGDWGNTYLYKCNNTFNFNFEKDVFYTGAYYNSTYKLENLSVTLEEGAKAIYMKVNLPQKFKKCSLAGVYFQAQGDDAVGIFVGQNFSSEANYINSSITNWEDNVSHRNCISKTLRPIAKFPPGFVEGYSGLSYAHYGSAFGENPAHCASSDFSQAYKNGSSFSLGVHNAGDDSEGFFGSPRIIFTYLKTTEVCNGIDDDCDGQIDEGAPGTTYYLDDDEDDYGDPSVSTTACSQPQKYVLNNTDCDDTNPARYPGNTENVSDGIDNDCDFTVDEGKTQQANCSSSVPSNATRNDGSYNGKFTQTWMEGSFWSPASKSFHHNSSVEECAWKCNSGFSYASSTNSCVANIQSATCSGSKPANTIWNDFGQNGSYTYTPPNPNKVTHYSLTEEDCAWKCTSTYHYESGACVIGERTQNCDLTDQQGALPENAKWNDFGNNGTYLEYWLNGWPTKIKATYSENPGKCIYACDQQSKACAPDQSTYCGTGTQQCDAGYWSTCAPTNAISCTTNQYCSNGDCSFCLENTKNCDLNLLNGCETNIAVDKNNCGECGTVCPTGKDCNNGSCVTPGTPSPEPDPDPDVDPCENVTCGSNQTCTLGYCFCTAGYNNCNGSSVDGCETLGSCNSVVFDCETNDDCSIDEFCNPSGECEQVDVEDQRCFVNEDCSDNSVCNANKRCEVISCGENFVIENRACVCPGKSCDGVCYTGTNGADGVCCNNKWNEGVSSCNVSISEIEEKVSNSNNAEAINLLNEANLSISRGEIRKGRIQADLAEISVDITNKPQYNIDFYAANLALQDEEYGEAELLISKIKSDLANEPMDFTGIAIAVLILAVIGVIIYFIYSKFFKLEKGNIE